MTPEQAKEARAHLDSLIERAQALSFDADRFNELHEAHQTAQYVAGWNLPGCLPEMEPATFETVEEAREFLADAIRETADQEEDENTAAAMTHAADQLSVNTHRAGNCHVNGLSYWWTPNETPIADPDDAKEYADMLATLRELALEPDEADDAQDRARERIQESALSVEVRTDWHAPGTTADQKPTEFNILLSTGGPATRIIGELDEHGTPDRARFEFQDWGIPWTDVPAVGQSDALLSFAQCFYFGE